MPVKIIKRRLKITVDCVILKYTKIKIRKEKGENSLWWDFQACTLEHTENEADSK